MVIKKDVHARNSRKIDGETQENQGLYLIYRKLLQIIKYGLSSN